jgi:hypothetical protein
LLLNKVRKLFFDARLFFLVLQKLNALKPLNLWLYEFANRLFDARVDFLKTGVYQRPVRKPMPEMTCLCTRLIMYCPGGELDFWISKEAPAGYEASFWNYLQQLGVKTPTFHL